MNTTDTMIYVLEQYQKLDTFDRENDPTVPILTGTLGASRYGIDVSEQWRGIALAAEMRMSARVACVDMWNEARKDALPSN